MPIPEEILQVERPTNTVVYAYGKRKDRYGVRERTGCKYIGGRRVPVNGGTIGHIYQIEPGKWKYVANDSDELPKPLSQASIDIKYWGAVTLCVQLTEDLINELLAVYSETDAYKIYCIAILRVCIPGIKDYELADAYEESFLSELYPGVALSKNTVSEFWELVGKAYSRIVRFMKTRVEKVSGHRKLVDGTLKSDESEVNTFSDYSRKAQKKGTRDISLLYCFDLDKMEPVCSKCYPGNMPDSVSYSDFLEEYGLNSGLIIGDKGFPSSCADDVFSQNPDLHFLNPLKRDSRYFKMYNLLEFDGQLPGHETILYKKVFVENEQKYLYVFKDTVKAHREDYNWLHRSQKGGDGYDDEAYKDDSLMFGVILLESDLDMTPLEAYLAYDSRWEIELVMRYYKQACEFDETRVHGDYSVIGSEFASFLSSVITYRLLNHAESTGILKELPYKKFLSILYKALKVRTEEGGEWKLTKMLPSQIKVLQNVGLIEKPAPKKRGRPPKN